MENNILEWILAFVHPIALIMALVFVISIAKRKIVHLVLSEYVIGGSFALALVYSMSDPISLGEVGIFDMRCLFIGVAVALISPKAGLITLATGLIYRFSIGGVGTVPGLVGMVIAFAGGYAWRIIVAKFVLSVFVRTLLLGVLISTHAFSILLAPSEFWYELATTLVPYMVLVNIMGVCVIKPLIKHEISFLSDAEQQKHNASADHLTGLLNRRSFEERYSKLRLPDNAEEGMSVIYFDIDNFKTVNDTNGHLFGDTVLKTIADRLRSVLRAGDLFCRMGGDEFVIILAGVQSDEAQVIAERCRQRIVNKPVSLGDLDVPITISIGAIWTGEKTDISQTLGMADAALYEAKNNGRNVVVFRRLPEHALQPLTAKAS